MLAESIKKTPLTSDKQNCALTLRFNDTLYEYYKKNPARGTRFARAMAGYIKSKQAHQGIMFQSCCIYMLIIFYSLHYVSLNWANSCLVNRDVATLADNFPWQQLSKKTVVDVGGGSGHTSMYLAKVRYEHMTMILDHQRQTHVYWG